MIGSYDVISDEELENKADSSLNNEANGTEKEKDPSTCGAEEKNSDQGVVDMESGDKDGTNEKDQGGDTNEKDILPENVVKTRIETVNLKKQEADNFLLGKEFEKAIRSYNQCFQFVSSLLKGWNKPLLDIKKRFSDEDYEILHKAGFTSIIKFQESDLPEGLSESGRKDVLQAMEDAKIEDAEAKSFRYRILCNLAMAFLKSEQWRKCINICETILEISPKDEKAILRRAVAKEGIGQYEEAKIEYRRILKDINPSNPTAKNRLRAIKTMEREEFEKSKRNFSFNHLDLYSDQKPVSPPPRKPSRKIKKKPQDTSSSLLKWTGISAAIGALGVFTMIKIFQWKRNQA